MTLMKTQVHPWFHLLATVLVVAAGCYFAVSRTEWCLLIIAIAIVWIAEAINTAIEIAIDLVSPDYHELAGQSKDVAAGAVLLAAIASAIVGSIIFWPHFSRLLVL